jgi:hypothetical protein
MHTQMRVRQRNFAGSQWLRSQYNKPMRISDATMLIPRHNIVTIVAGRSEKLWITKLDLVFACKTNSRGNLAPSLLDGFQERK